MNIRRQNEMTVYAFKNKTTGEYVVGTDFKHSPPIQNYNENLAPIICGSLFEAVEESKRLHMNHDFKIVRMILKEDK